MYIEVGISRDFRGEMEFRRLNDRWISSGLPGSLNLLIPILILLRFSVFRTLSIDADWMR